MKTIPEYVLPETTVVGKTEIAPGFSVEWLDDGRIAKLAFGNTTRAAVEAFYQVAMQMVDTADRSSSLLILNDFTSPGFAMTPALRKHIEAVSRHTEMKNLNCRVALIMTNKLSTQLMQLFMRASSIVSRNQAVQVRMFTSEDQALGWLRELFI